MLFTELKDRSCLLLANTNEAAWPQARAEAPLFIHSQPDLHNVSWEKGGAVNTAVTIRGEGPVTDLLEAGDQVFTSTAQHVSVWHSVNVNNWMTEQLWISRKAKAVFHSCFFLRAMHSDQGVQGWVLALLTKKTKYPLISGQRRSREKETEKTLYFRSQE